MLGGEGLDLRADHHRAVVVGEFADHRRPAAGRRACTDRPRLRCGRSASARRRPWRSAGRHGRGGRNRSRPCCRWRARARYCSAARRKCRSSGRACTSTETVKAVPSGASFIATIGDRCSRRASSPVSGAQTMPQQLRMMNAIFSGVQSEAATMRSPSFSRSSSSVTTTISPRANASIAWVTGCDISLPQSDGGAPSRKSFGVTAPRVSTQMRWAVSRDAQAPSVAAHLRHRARRNADAAREIGALDAAAREPLGELHGEDIGCEAFERNSNPEHILALLKST